jgi:hypothetical protein
MELILQKNLLSGQKNLKLAKFVRFRTLKLPLANAPARYGANQYRTGSGSDRTQASLSCREAQN